jgi:predicted transcriptional regulator of viral defense system
MNAHPDQKHSLLGIEMVRNLYEEGKRIFTIQDAREAAPSCGIADSYVVESLHHLAKTNWIVPLKKGLYAVSSSFPGMAPLHEFEIGQALVHPSAISHWSALHFHGLTEQIPGKVYITTTRAVAAPRTSRIQVKNQKSSSREINGVVYEFIKTNPDRFFGIEHYWVGETRIAMTDPERTFIDGLIAPRHFGDWAEIYHAFELYASKLDLEKITTYSLRLDAAVVKRLGWVLENLKTDEAFLQRLEEIAVKGYRTLDSGGPRRGPYNRKWMIQENLPGKVIS